MVEGNGLENRKASNGLVGSNPTLSAKRKSTCMEDTQNTFQNPHGQVHFAWMVDEYPVYHRGWVWYLVAGVIGAGIVLYALVTLNFLFALIVVIFGIVLTLSAARTPVRLRFAVTEDGLEMGHRFMPWKDLARFSVVYEPPEVKTLYFDFKNAIVPELAVPLEQMNPNAVRKALLTYIDEDLTRDSEPVTDYLSRVLKF